MEAERNERVERFKQINGDLEAVRLRLNLSKRQISELLWVEPSAWTRWSTGISQPPDHIFRALGWYLQLCELKGDEPAAAQAPKKAVEALPKAALPNMEFEVSSQWTDERQKLLQEIERKEALSFGWKLILVICLAISIFNLIF